MIDYIKLIYYYYLFSCYNVFYFYLKNLTVALERNSCDDSCNLRKNQPL